MSDILPSDYQQTIDDLQTQLAERDWRIAELEKKLAQAVSSELTASAVVLDLEERIAADRDIQLAALRDRDREIERLEAKLGEVKGS